MNVINLKGTIELSNCIPTDQEAIKNILRETCESGLDGVTIEEDVIFLDATFNNENSFAESLANIISSKLRIGHEDITLECTGESLSDRYDIVIRQNKVYIQEYDLVPGEITLYTVK